MSNVLLTADRISRLGVQLLTRSLVLGRTVSQVPGPEFSGPTGGKVILRVPVPRDSRIQATPGALITFDDVDEVPIPVTLRHHYNGTVVTDEDLSLTLEDFGTQILQPQISAVAKGAENEAAAVLNAIPSTINDVAVANFDARILQARRILGRNEVPLGDRWVAMSPEFAEVALETKLLSEVDASGNPSALADAVVGRYRGFNFVESAGIAAGQAVAYHMSAIGMGIRAPVAPQGAAQTSSAEDGGISLRVVYDYDSSRLSDTVVTSTFAGAALVEDRDPDGEGEDPTILKRAVGLALNAG